MIIFLPLYIFFSSVYGDSQRSAGDLSFIGECGGACSAGAGEGGRFGANVFVFVVLEGQGLAGHLSLLISLCFVSLSPSFSGL